MKRESPFPFLAFLVAAALAGCGKDETQPKDAPAPPAASDKAAPTPEKNVSWFMSNREEMKRVLKACKENPGALAGTPDCVNASAARDKLIVQEMKDAVKGGPK
jgi:glucose/arabinose dehydrogenase